MLKEPAAQKLRRHRSPFRSWQVRVSQAPAEAKRQRQEPEQETDKILFDARDEVIACVSDYCIAFALVTDDVLIRPIELGDLPPALPVYSQLFAPRPINSFRFLIEAHERWARPEPIRVGDKVGLEVDRLFHSRPDAGGENTLFDAYAVFAQARQELEIGRFASAVREASTGIEIITMTLFREVAGRRASEVRVDGWIRSGFKNVLSDHLPRELGLRVDLTCGSEPIGSWIDGAYKIRNETVHGGHPPTRHEAKLALDQTMTLVDHIREAVTARDDLQRLTSWFLYPQPDATRGDV